MLSKTILCSRCASCNTGLISSTSFVPLASGAPGCFCTPSPLKASNLSLGECYLLPAALWCFCLILPTLKRHVVQLEQGLRLVNLSVFHRVIWYQTSEPRQKCWMYQISYEKGCCQRAAYQGGMDGVVCYRYWCGWLCIGIWTCFSDEDALLMLLLALFVVFFQS